MAADRRRLNLGLDLKLDQISIAHLRSTAGQHTQGVSCTPPSAGTVTSVQMPPVWLAG